MRASISAARPPASSPICAPTASTWRRRRSPPPASVIGAQYGDRYVPSSPRRYTTKQKNAQEAHEAIRPTDLARLPKDIARRLDAEQAKLYELIWTRTIASQMESAELERTTVDIAAAIGGASKIRRIDLRATGQVVRFDGFLKLYQEGKDDEEDEESGRLPPMQAGDRLKKDKIEATQHFTEPPPRYTEATLVKRMEELGIGRPSTYASTLTLLRDRDYVRLEKKRLVPEDKGRLLTAFLEGFFTRYVEYNFTADLEEKLDQVSNHELDWKEILRDFWRHFSAALDGTKELRTTAILDSLNDVLGPHIFPAKEDGSNPRACPLCGTGQVSLKLGKFGAFIGCSNYPDCKYTRTLSAAGADQASAIDGERPGVRVLGIDPATAEEISLREGRFGAYLQLGDGDKPKRSSLPKTIAPADITLDQAIALLALPREVAKHPQTHAPILAGIGRYGPYVQHGAHLCQSRQGRRHPVDRRQPGDRSHRRQGERGQPLRQRRWCGPRARRTPGRRTGDGQGRPFRPLCQSRQCQCHAAARHAAGGPDARRGARPAAGQGRRAVAAVACSAIIRWAGRSLFARGVTVPM